MGPLETSLRAHANDPYRERTLNSILDKSQSLSLALLSQANPDNYDFKAALWVIWEQRGPDALTDLFEDLVLGPRIFPHLTFVQDQEALRALMQSWPDPEQRVLLQRSVAHHAIYKYHLHCYDWDEAPSAFIDWVRPFLDELLSACIASVLETGQAPLPGPKRTWRVCTLWVLRDALEPMALPLETRAAMARADKTLADTKHNRTFPSLVTMLQTLPEELHHQILTASATPLWMLHDDLPRDVLREVLLRYIEEREHALVVLFKEGGELDWSDALVYHMPHIPVGRAHAFLYKTAFKLKSLPLDTLREATTRYPAGIVLLLYPCLKPHLNLEILVQQWPGAPFVLLQILALYAHELALEGDFEALEALEAISDTESQRELLQVTRQRLAPDWEALVQEEVWTALAQPDWLVADLQAWRPWSKYVNATCLRTFPRLMLSLFRVALQHNNDGYNTFLLLKNAPPLWVAAAVQAWLPHGDIRNASKVYAMLLSHQIPVSAQVHLAFLAQGSSTAQKKAMHALLPIVDANLPDITAMLGAKKASARQAAARLLALAGKAEAVGPLKAALSKEKSKKVKPLIQEALEICDAAARKFKQETRDPQGVYRIFEPMEPGAGMESLRALIHEPPTRISWLRLCDLLEKLRTHEMLPVALDYLTPEVLARWQWRDLPTTWQHDTKLSRLGKKEANAPLWWMPISCWATDAREAFLDKALRSLEARARVRKLHREHVDLFLRWVERGWFWCQEHDIPIHNLAVRLDGGVVPGGSRSRPQSTSLELNLGFRAFVRREQHNGKGRFDAGIRWVKVSLPKEHILRIKHKMSPHQASLDLTRILRLEDKPAT